MSCVGPGPVTSVLVARRLWRLGHGGCISRFPQAIVVAFATAAVVAVHAQPAKPAFEVASVKPINMKPPGFHSPQVLRGGGFSARYSTVERLLMFAYELPGYRVVGGPDWMSDGRFEIFAKATGDAPREQIKLMVQSLLEERFKLVAHMEERVMDFQALVLARPDGHPGPSLVRIDECSAAAVNELRRTSPDRYPTPEGGGITAGCSPLAARGESQFTLADLRDRIARHGQTFES